MNYIPSDMGVALVFDIRQDGVLIMRPSGQDVEYKVIDLIMSTQTPGHIKQKCMNAMRQYGMEYHHG